MAHFKQENGYGCGLYALANALIKESIITPTRLIESKTGNNLGQLNKWLLEDGYDLFLEPLYFSATENRLPETICEIKPQCEGVLAILKLQYEKRKQFKNKRSGGNQNS